MHGKHLLSLALASFAVLFDWWGCGNPIWLRAHICYQCAPATLVAEQVLLQLLRYYILKGLACAGLAAVPGPLNLLLLLQSLLEALTLRRQSGFSIIGCS